MIFRFIMKRVSQGAFVILFLSIISFAIINAAPGDPATALYGPMASRLTVEERARINRNYGVDKPVMERYIEWTKNIFKGEFGISYVEGRKVTVILGEKLPNTFILYGISISLIIIFSLIIGLKAGFNEGSVWDRFISGVSIMMYSIPPFWVALILIMIFSVKLKILPSAGVKSIGNEDDVLDLLKHMIMPVTVIVLAHIGAYSKFIQEKVKEEVNSNYVTAAIANGMDEKKLKRGILKNTIGPFINYLGVTIPGFFGGSVIVESVFNWPGLGMLSIKAAGSKDYPLLMGTIFVTGVLVVLSIMIIDILELIINPAIRKQVT